MRIYITIILAFAASRWIHASSRDKDGQDRFVSLLLIASEALAILFVWEI